MRIPKDWVFVFPIDKLEGLVAIVKKNLCEHSNSAEHNMMLTPMMPEYVIQGPPTLEAPILTVSCLTLAMLIAFK